MASVVLSQPEPRTKLAGARSPFSGVIATRAAVKWPIRYALYAFVFSLPFEESGFGIGLTLPKLFGLCLAAFCLVQPRACYKPPAKAFWCFAAYALACMASALYLVLTPPQDPELLLGLRSTVFRLVQLLVLFCITYNLMKHEQIVKGVLWTLVAATIVLAVMQLLGITSNVSEHGRVTAFETNPNGVAAVLSLGLLALFGLAYGREKKNWKARLLFWLTSAVLAIPIVETGSRGAVVALTAGLAIFFLRGKDLATKIKFGAIGLFGIMILAVASYSIEPIRARWEQAIYDQNVAGRDRIFSHAINMIREKPLTGWGPIVHNWELGSRLGLATRDEHNVYLWVLAEVGILGAMPFFAGLWLCWRAAWKARRTIQGILPAVMLLFVLVSSLSASLTNRKYYWLILSFAAASATYPAARRPLRPGVLSRRAFGPGLFRQGHFDSRGAPPRLRQDPGGASRPGFTR
ncbi:MAG TPA: O-antigen ligase family protein [Candidatus Acidoferrales bacterium]|nr:O-antigen ligase family protein [Candidatus Acidoferrales bacterium]